MLAIQAEWRSTDRRHVAEQWSRRAQDDQQDQPVAQVFLDAPQNGLI